MNSKCSWRAAAAACVLPLLSGAAHASTVMPITLPLVLDHNRMLVEAEVQARDGTWRTARLWIDSGNPDFMVSEAFARALGFDVPDAPDPGAPREPVSLPHLGVRLNGTALDLDGITATVLPGAQPLWATMHADANLPSTVLRRYRVVFDYPGRRLHLLTPGAATHRGVPVPARVHPQTGIVQVEALVGAERLSLALDVGASYSFVSGDVLARLGDRNKAWPRVDRALGCANIWGLWPEEDRWPVLRAPRIRLGQATVAGVGLVGLPNFFGNGVDLGTWYSRKTSAPVVGFLGPNAFKGFRLEIDYGHGMVYLERRAPDEVDDMNLVGLTLQPAAGGLWRILGAAVEGVEPGDVLLQVGELAVTGQTMGAVVDALRGRPGDVRVLVIERQGQRLRVEARVRRFL